jgi:hypothetical protein
MTWVCVWCDIINARQTAACVSCSRVRIVDQNPPEPCVVAQSDLARSVIDTPRQPQDTKTIVGQLLEIMASAPKQPSLQCRSCKQLQRIMKCGRKSAITVVELKAYVIVVKSMNANLRNKVLQVQFLSANFHDFKPSSPVC